MAVDIQDFLRKIEQDPTLRQGLITLLEAATPDKQQLDNTSEDFLEWTDEDTLSEWVNEKIVGRSPASRTHQDLAGFLASLLRIYTETHALGLIYFAPFQMKLKHSKRKPDLLFVSHEHLDRLKTTYLDGPADLIIEIVSSDSVEQDRGKKFVEYEAAYVPEYWLIDPLRQWAECYQLGEEDRYITAFAGNKGDYHAAVLPDFWLKIEWLWQTPLPPVLDVIGELGLLEARTRTLKHEHTNPLTH